MRTSTTLPDNEPIDFDLAKLQLNLDDNAQETLVDIYIANARAFAESATGLSLVTQTRQVTYFAEESAATLPLPYGPVQSISSVVDSNDSTLDAASYELQTFGSVDYIHLINGASFPITVTYVAGFGDEYGDNVPGDIRGAMLAHISDQFLHREGMTAATAKALEDVYSGYRNGLSVGK